MNVAIVTMVYNEQVNLPVWIRHYRRIAPTATLIVVDHASNDGSTERLDGVTRLRIPRSEMDEWARTRFMIHLQRSLLEYYDLFIHTDCDELIVPDPDQAATLEQYFEARPYAYTAPVGVNLIHLVELEPDIDLAKPLLSQRRYCHFQATMCKPVIARVPMNWQPGFHESDKPVRIDPDLYLFHTKAVDRRIALQRLHITQQVAWSKAALDASHGAHHRYDDARFEREFFLDRMNVFRKAGAHAFNFEGEIARLESEAALKDGVYRIRPFAGPVVEIPERFRSCL